MHHYFYTLCLFSLVFLSACGGGASGPETQDWQAASSKGTEAALDSFLLQYPNSSYKAEAESRIEGMLWQFAIEENTVYNYAYYRKRFPNGKHAGEVEAKLQAIAKDELDLAYLTSRTFAGVIRHDKDEIQVISLKFAQIEQTGSVVRFVADINASNNIRKMVPGEIQTADNRIVFQEESSDAMLLGISEGRAYVRNGRTLLQSTDPNQYWSLK